MRKHKWVILTILGDALFIGFLSWFLVTALESNDLAIIMGIIVGGFSGRVMYYLLVMANDKDKRNLWST